MIWTLIIILNFGSVNEIRREITDVMSFEACIKRGISEMERHGDFTGFQCVPGHRI